VLGREFNRHAFNGGYDECVISLAQVWPQHGAILRTIIEKLRSRIPTAHQKITEVTGTIVAKSGHLRQ
jgi:hypothetical protein